MTVSLVCIILKKALFILISKMIKIDSGLAQIFKDLMALKNINKHFPFQFPFHFFYEDIWKFDIINMCKRMLLFVG